MFWKELPHSNCKYSESYHIFLSQFDKFIISYQFKLLFKKTPSHFNQNDEAF